MRATSSQSRPARMWITKNEGKMKTSQEFYTFMSRFFKFKPRGFCNTVDQDQDLWRTQMQKGIFSFGN